jgi:hypothetical protein
VRTVRWTTVLVGYWWRRRAKTRRCTIYIHSLVVYLVKRGYRGIGGRSARVREMRGLEMGVADYSV